MDSPALGVVATLNETVVLVAAVAVGIKFVDSSAAVVINKIMRFTAQLLRVLLQIPV